MARLVSERPEVDIFEGNFSASPALNGGLEDDVFVGRSRFW